MTIVKLSLDKELKTFNNLLPSLMVDEGRFALIADEELLGIFDTYGDALSAGYEKRGLEPFLVKQIATFEVVANFSRNVAAACHISPM